MIAVGLMLSASGCDSVGGNEDSNESCLYGVLTSKVRALDPADIWDTSSTLAGSQIFESLYQFHYLKRPYEIVCQLAESEPQVSAGGLFFTIRIKKGVYFADDDCFENGVGRELKASDFVYAWERIADIKNLSRNWWIFDNRIAGLDEFREYTKSSKSKAEVDYKNCFNRIGLDVSIEYMDWPTFQERIQNKDVQIFSMGWIAQYPDAENFLQVFYSKNASGGINSFNYCNAKFDRIYEKASLMEESEKRSELYRQAEQIVIEDCCAVFLRHGAAYVLHQSWLRNYKPNSFGYGLSKYRGVDMAKRMAYQKVYD